MSENMARLSKEHYAAIEHTETPIKSSIKNRFTNIFKSSPSSSMDNLNEAGKLQPGFVKTGLHSIDRTHLSDESPHSSRIVADVKPQELAALTAVDKVINAIRETDAEQLINEWQTELEQKKGRQTVPTEPSYSYRNTIDEILEVDSNWFSHSRDDEEDEGFDDLQSSPAVEKGMSIIEENTIDSWDKHIAEISDTSPPHTPTANRYSAVHGEYENVEKSHTVQTFSPIIEEYVTELGEIIQDKRHIQKTKLDSPTVEGDDTKVDDNLEDDVSVNSTHSPYKLLVNTELLQQLYEQGVPTPEGVQFYVNRKITEALLAHEEKFHRSISDRHLEAPKLVKVGPVIITDPVLVSYSRKVVRLMYYATLFCAASAGPKTFFVCVWRMVVIFGVYEVAMREFGWKNKQMPDLLLEPLHHGFDELLEKGEGAAMRLGYTLGPFIGGIVKGIVDEDDDEEVEE